MDNLLIYNNLKTPPKTALKPILAGRLKGKTDISPQWRIMAMTEQFGICGIGWKYDIIKQWSEQSHSGEVFAFININLYFKHEGEWSDAIPGTGGTLLIANEKNGLYSDDEAYKKSLTDALGVAMRAIGIGADVYMGLMNSGSKYVKPENDQTNFEARDLLHSEVDLWNGTIYKGNLVYINNKKIQPSPEQIVRLKAHIKYKE